MIRIIKKLGLLLMAVSLVSLSLPAPIILAVPTTTVEVNEGATITIDPDGEIVANAGFPGFVPATGIPVDIKGIVVSENGTGLAGWEFILNWDADVIEVDNIILGYDANNVFHWGLTPGTIDNTAGNTTYIGTTTTEPYSAANITMLLIGITAVGHYGDSTTLSVTVTDLIDDERVAVPTTTVNALIEIPLGTLESIEVTPDPASMELGDTLQLSANGTYSSGGDAEIADTVNWDSSDTNVATIDAAGLATAVGEGTTDITAELDGVTSDPVVTLTVVNGDVDHIDILPATAGITADDTQTYTANATNTHGGTWDVTAGTTFSINGSAGGSFTDNVYDPEVVGSWTVTGNHTASGLQDTAALTVTVGAADAIVIEPSTATITADGTQA
ncbi:Ig domain-containing protein, partial [Chloroflexota bacterium]